MDEKLWVARSQNLYIIRELWREYSDRSMDSFYEVIGIKDSVYSAFIRKSETDAEAVRLIEKRKDKITGAGFKYEWFTGKKYLCDSVFMINDAEWKRFVQVKRGTDMYTRIDSKIYDQIKCVMSEPQREYHFVYNVIQKLNPNRIANRLDNYLSAIDLSSISESEIDGLVALADKMERFISDAKAIKRYHEIMKKKR